MYVGHALVVWVGLAWQLRHIYITQSAEDITLVWACCLLAGELLALPRAIHSPYKVWKACHLIAVCLIAVLLVGVWRFG